MTERTNQGARAHQELARDTRDVDALDAGELETPELSRGTQRSVTLLAIVVACIALVGGVVLIASWVASLKEAAVLPEPAPPVVRTEVIRRSRVPLRVEATGFLRPDATIHVAAEAQGRLLELPVPEGARVEAGTVVARIDDRVPRRRVEAGKARETSLRAQLDFVAKELERERGLAERGTGRPADLDRLESERARLDAALLENAASIAEVELHLEKCEVVVEREGVWDEALVEVGELVVPGQALGVLRDLSPLELEVEVGAAARLALEVGRSVEVELLDVEPALSRVTRAVDGATIARLPSAESPMTRRYPVIVRVPDPEAKLLPGLYARVRIELERAEEIILVPKECVSPRHGRKSLWVLDRSDPAAPRARTRYIEVRGVAGDPARWHVVSGLDVDEQLILEPLERLTEGCLVVPGSSPGDPGEGRASDGRADGGER